MSSICNAVIWYPHKCDTRTTVWLIVKNAKITTMQAPVDMGVAQIAQGRKDLVVVMVVVVTIKRPLLAQGREDLEVVVTISRSLQSNICKAALRVV